jgi:hypothetical protein
VFLEIRHLLSKDASGTCNYIQSNIQILICALVLPASLHTRHVGASFDGGSCFVIHPRVTLHPLSCRNRLKTSRVAKAAMTLLSSTAGSINLRQQQQGCWVPPLSNNVNHGGRMGGFCLLHLLCMLPVPVPLTFLQPAWQHSSRSGIGIWCADPALGVVRQTCSQLVARRENMVQKRLGLLELGQ